MQDKLINELIAQLKYPIDSDSESSSSIPEGIEETYVRFSDASNGGYTNDRYIHVFGRSGPTGHNVFGWNDPDLWKKYYDLDEKIFCFAEDLFGNQYCFDLHERPGTVKMLWVDDGDLIFCSPSFEDFIEDSVLKDEGSAQMRDLSRRYFEESGVRYEPFHHLSNKHQLLLGVSDTDLGNLELSKSVVHIGRSTTASYPDP